MFNILNTIWEKTKSSEDLDKNFGLPHQNFGGDFSLWTFGLSFYTLNCIYCKNIFILLLILESRFILTRSSISSKLTTENFFLKSGDTISSLSTITSISFSKFSTFSYLQFKTGKFAYLKFLR